MPQEQNPEAPKTVQMFALTPQQRDALLEWFDTQPMPARQSRPFLQLLQTLPTINVNTTPEPPQG